MKMYFKNNRTALIFLLAMLVVAPIKAQVAFGDAAKFNDGWLFRLTDDSAIVRTDYDDSEWRKLSLHTRLVHRGAIVAHTGQLHRVPAGWDRLVSQTLQG